MITELSLQHFKCFEAVDLPLGPLTLLTGVNAGGKSSVIQALVLLHQTVEANPNAGSLLLNGDEVALGCYDDVIDKITGRDFFGIGVGHHSLRVAWEYSAESKDSVRAPTRAMCLRHFGEQVPLLGIPTGGFLPAPATAELVKAAPKDLESLNASIEKLAYLSTDRIGPRETYQIDPTEEAGIRVGSRGEFTAWYLHRHRELLVRDRLCYLDATKTLIRQVEAWLSDFLPGAGIEVEPVEGTNLVTLRIRTDPAGKYYRPQNVGYGITHILPVLTVCLSAEPGQTLIIENPEAHLHPAAQSKIGLFLAKAVASGIQVILESHSDHVLNGIRRAVREKILQPQEVVLHYFNRREELKGGESQVTSLQVGLDGNIDHWPAGFFDQFERDLAYFSNWS
jgi:predicted ATPase